MEMERVEGLRMGMEREDNGTEVGWREKERGREKGMGMEKEGRLEREQEGE